MIETIFNCDCEGSFCLRDALLGISPSRAGIKKYYQTNRKRSIDYAITILLAEYNAGTLKNLRDTLTSKLIFQRLSGPFILYRNILL